jgi:hypothetical protein
MKMIIVLFHLDIGPVLLFVDFSSPSLKAFFMASAVTISDVTSILKSHWGITIDYLISI